MSLKTSITAILGISTLLTSGCVTESDTYIQRVGVVDTVAPDTGSVNTDIPILIKFQYSNGCGLEGWAIERRNGRYIDVSIYGKYVGAFCTGAMKPDSTVYVFKAESPGKYYLFYEDSEYAHIADTIIIR